jgi:hypothetical protein
MRVEKLSYISAVCLAGASIATSHSDKSVTSAQVNGT